MKILIAFFCLLFPFGYTPIHVVHLSNGDVRPGKLKWKFTNNSRSYSTPTVMYDKVYIGKEDGYCYAIDALNGKVVWKFKTLGAVNSSPAVFNHQVFFGSMDGYYYAVDAQTGRLRWRFKTGGEKKLGRKGLWGMQPNIFYMEDPFDFFISSPVVDGKRNQETVYFGSTDGILYALDAENGRLKWKFATSGAIRSTPCIYEGMVYFGSWDKYVYALDKDSGKLVWKYQTKSDPENHLLEGIQASVTADKGRIFIGSRDGYFYSLDAKNGSLNWEYSTWPSWIASTSFVQDSIVFLGTSDSFKLIGLDVATGKEKLSVKTKGYNFSSTTNLQNRLFFGDFTGSCYSMNMDTGSIDVFFETDGRKKHKAKLLNQEGKLDFQQIAGNMDPSLYSTTVEVVNILHQLEPIIANPVISNKTLYLSTASGSLYALSLSDN